MAYTNDHEAQALSLIRDWQAYLRARQIILSQTGATDAFERDTGSQALEDAEASMAALGQERRRLFEAAFQERRQVWQTALETEQGSEAASIFLDQSMVEQRTLAECLELAEGHKHPDGAGYVRYPALQGEPITWHDAYMPDLDSIPDEAAYRLSQRHGQRRERLIRIGAGLLLLPLCALLLWTLFAPETEAVTAKDERVPNKDVTFWSQTGVSIQGAETRQMFDLNTVDSLPWPDDGQAHMLSGAQLPLQVCVPAKALEDIRQLHILGDGIIPERIYSLSDEQSIPTDLLIAGCTQASVTRRAYLSETRAEPAAQIGDALSLGQDFVLQLEQATVRGPAEDSSIPEQSMHVVLTLAATVSSTTTPDWTSYAPSLYLLDGSIQAAPQIAAHGSAVELIYLVKNQHSRSQAELHLTDTAGKSIRWRFPLEIPADRITVLGKALRIEALEASGSGIMVRITNQSTAPLLLQQDDVVVSQDALPFAQQTIPGLENALAPGETRQIQLAIPDETVGELELRVGPYRYRIIRGAEQLKR